jgi:ABC-2 type transport system permease protein
MNVFWHELRMNRMSTLVWASSLALLVILFLNLYPAFTKDVDASLKILANLPLPVREALGISLGNFFTIFGFYSYLFTFVTLAGAIQAMNLGVGSIAKERSGKTADFLLAKPISRSSVVTQKILAAVTILFITNIIFVVVAFMTALAVSTKSFNMTTFFLISLTLLLTQLVFLAVGVFFSVLIPKVRSIIAISLPTVFVFFIIGSLGAIIGNDNVKYVTPFKFYDPQYIMQHNSYELKYMLIELVVIFVAIVATYVLFNKKDVPSAT